MTNHRDEVAEVFRTEVSEMLDALAGLLEHIEVAPPEARARDIHAAFRIMHNMKGAAAVFGAMPLSTLAHAVEDALDRLRKLESGPSQEDMSLIAETLPIFEGLAAGTIDDNIVNSYVAKFKSTDSNTPRTTAEDAPAPTVRFDSPLDRKRTPSSDQARQTPEQHTADTFVRVDVSRLDRLLADVGELLPLQSHFLGHKDELESILEILDDSPDDVHEARRRLGNMLRTYATDARKLMRCVDDVVETTKHVRMLPLSTQAAHWKRLVHDVARTLEKQVDVDVEVGDIELDKRVFDALRDPFFHLLRNAVDHGLELPQVRINRGKCERGRILISAHVVGTMVEIDVSDDGAGIDADAVCTQAIKNGIISPEEATELTWDEATALVFRPGLSTATSVSNVSGRGVGLDAVRQDIHTLGGTVSIVAPIIGGTTFRINIPMTVALLRGLLVRADNHPLVLPIEHLEHVRRVQVAGIRRVDAMYMLDTENETIQLHGGDAGVRLGKQRPTDTITVVVLSHGTQRWGFVVEAVLGEHHFITHALPWNLQSIPGVSGVVILPDGTVAPILDVARFHKNDPVAVSKAMPSHRETAARVLVVDDSMSIRTMMRNALESAGYQVFVNADGHDAWETLQSREVDLLVSDINMPRVDGLELTRRVRSDARLAHLPVVLVTSRDRKEDLVAGANAGANEYLVKAELDQTKLLEAVARLV